MDNYSLTNKFISATFDSHGNFLSFRNLISGEEFIKPHGLWRMIIKHVTNLEYELLSNNSIPECQLTNNKFHLKYNQLKSEDGTIFKITLNLYAELNDDEIIWNIDMKNDCNPASGVEIREYHFPILSLSDSAQKMAMHSSHWGGTVFSNIRAFAQSGFSAYKSTDQKYSRVSLQYPYPLATNNSCFSSGKNTLYLASCDSTFQDTCHVTEIEKYDEYLNQFIVKFPFLAPGKSLHIEKYVVSAINGNWYKAADKYRKWADSWFKAAPKTTHIKETLGWLRIIARTQYGKNIFPFTALPEIAKTTLEAGLDTIFLFGWHQGGHDNDYPNYIPSQELGGEVALRNNIAEIQKKGCKVILYTNGQLIDKNSDFYRHVGHKISNKDRQGNEPQQFYGFSGQGIAQNIYGNRTFVTACFGTKEWFEVLKGIVDIAYDYGCDGVFFDQIGSGCYACCDSTHGHAVPFLNAMSAKMAALEKLRCYMDSNYPNMSLGIEVLSDVTCGYADYVHSLSAISTLEDLNWQKNGTKPQFKANMDWMLYTFPEVKLSNREIRDEYDREILLNPSLAPMEFRVNFMVRKNLFSDVEIYRCLGTLADTPKYNAYLTMANQFKKRNAKYLQNAKFRADSLHHCDNNMVDSDGFITLNGSVIVIVSQSASEEEKIKISVEKMSLKQYDIMHNGSINEDGILTLGRHGLAMLVFDNNLKKGSSVPTY